MPITREAEITEQVLHLLSSPERTGTSRTADPLPPAPRWGLPVTELVRRRRSVRSFAAEPVETAQLREIIDTAHARHRDLSVLLAAYRISGLTPGTYLLESGGDPTRCAEYPLESIRETYADAAAVLLICGDLASACDKDGANGYSRLLVQAGSFAYTAWLTAVSLGLAGSVYGRSDHGADTAARRLSERRHLFTIALGHATVAEGPASCDRRGNE
jgi:nitroreductase